MLNKLIKTILYWRLKYIGPRTFLILASILVGLISGLAAVFLKQIVHLLHKVPTFFANNYETNYWYIFLPLSGIVITALLVKIFWKGKIDKSLGSIIYAINRKSAKIEKEKTYTHIATSGITIGLGGSAGLEAPIVITGSAIGSNIASILRLGQKERTLLLACGAASGIAAIFNSPIAGVVFALEVLLTEFTIPVFIPLLISTATATIISKLLYSGQLFYLISDDWYLHAIPFYVILGGACGLISVYTTRITLKVEGLFSKWKNVISKAIFGGLLLGLMIYIFPPLFGEGYDIIKSLLSGNYNDFFHNSYFIVFKDNPWIFLLVVLATLLLKVFATSITIGAGGNGGIIAPSLFIGALTGFGLSFFVNTTEISNLCIANFIVVGMAGILSGVVHAPLTAIFLIAEITGGYVLIVPLMIVSALSYFIAKYFEPYSIYTKKIAQKGHWFFDDKDANILKMIKIDDLIETDFIQLKLTDDFTVLIEAFSKSNRNIFPVIDSYDNFIGLVNIEKVKEIMFKPELHSDLKISEFITHDVVTIDITESIEAVMNKFEKSELWNMPVLNGKSYIGFVSRSNIFTYYRRILKRSAKMF